MTDNRTTELLREFTENAIYCNQFGSLYADEERIAEYAERIEQAIAATLGSGTLTAEQVRGAVKRHSSSDAFSRRLFKVNDWQAIADELNELGSGTCEIEPIFPKAPDGTQLFGFRCKSCGFSQSIATSGLEAVHRQWNLCPNCGARIRKAVER